MDETPHEAGTPRTGSAESVRDRVDPLSLVAGLVFLAVAFAVLIERFWLEIDPVLVAGGAVAAAGATMIMGTVLRHLRRDQTSGGEPQRDR